ncbi:MAG TPA: cyanophycin synthetase [Candidatus Saccharimonadales bacterium]|nr:cyanophycin synthetase [Candidatus Saccharimonadales bacterium]
MPRIKTFADVEAALAALRPNTMVPVLHAPQNTPELMEFLGNPQDSYKVIHVAGTSGKTSTAYYAAAVLLAAGKKVGLTISPHADSIAERVQINGQPLPEAEFCADFARFLELIAPANLPLNYFQGITAFALWEFAQKGVEYAVVEVGIGGLADSTNVFRQEGKVCVINDIGYAHMAVLGNSLGEIAGNKAGIIQLHNTVFARQQPAEIMAPIVRRAQLKQADLHIISDEAAYAFLPLFQRRNFAMAAAAAGFALERDGAPAPTAAQLETAARTNIPARMEIHQLSGKTIILDGAHNAQKVRALVASVQARYPGQDVAVLFGATRAKPEFFQRMLAELAPLRAHVIVTTFPSGAHGKYGSTDPQNIVQELAAQHISHELITDAAAAFHALQQRNEPVLLVTGSFYLLNVIRPLLAAAGGGAPTGP